jgi:uracil-DNA glycosylase family 4
MVRKKLPAEDQNLTELGTQEQNHALSQKRHALVVGEGNPHAELVFIGESPGEEENLLCQPFFGEAGQLLTRMIEAMGLKREHVYISNLVQCPPPDHGEPESDEIPECSPFLAEKLAQIQPKVVVALGKYAAQSLLQSKEQISDLRGKFYTYTHIHAHAGPNSLQIMPTFHPSDLLKNPASKRAAWSDLQQVAQALGIQLPKR